MTTIANLSPIAKLKVQLYSALLDKHRAELTNSEIEMMFIMSRDDDIQAVLRKCSNDAVKEHKDD